MTNPYWQLGSKRIGLERPRIMAIVNADPESFYPGSRLSAGSAETGERLARLLEAGADVLDIGGQSTRPGSVAASEEEELARVIPLIRLARELAPDLPLSVDTFRTVVAREALAAGADGVNDISAGGLDPQLWELVAASGCGYVLMHMRGTPQTMQQDVHYDDCVAEVAAFLGEKRSILIVLGVEPQRIALDPGIGFGKRLQDNLALIGGAERLRKLVGAHGRAPGFDTAVPGAQPCAPTEDRSQPCAPALLYGLSRKSFINTLMKQAGQPEAAALPEQRLPATLGATWALLDQGVMLHRVHDVAETRQLMTLWEALRDTR